MKRGRKPVYESFQNIVNIRTQSKHRMGKCSICQKDNIKAVDWIRHQHENEQNDKQNKINQSCIKNLMDIAIDVISRYSSQFLQYHFKDGISEEHQVQYTQNMVKSMASALTTFPRIQKGNSEEKDGLSSKMSKKIKLDKEEKDRVSGIFIDRQFLDQIFFPFYYYPTQYSLKLKNMMLVYAQTGKNLLSLKNHLTSCKNPKEDLLHIIKQCIHCKETLFDKENECKQCSFCHSKVHLSCYQKIKYCICTGINLSNITHSFSPQNGYRPVPDIQSYDLLRSQYHGIIIFYPTTPISEIIKTLKSRSLPIYTYEALYPSYSIAEPDAFYNPFLTYAQKKLIEAYNLYKCQKYKAPIKLKILGRNNYGIEAIQTIHKYALICQYACDLLPCIYACSLPEQSKNKIMHYSSGRNGREELMLAPVFCSNWAPLINTPSQDMPGSRNCKSVRVVIENKIRVLIFAIRQIKAGQELLYDYNGDFEEYSTF